MKKIAYLLIFVSFLFTLKAQDTIYPFEPGQIYDHMQSDVYYIGPHGIACGGPSIHSFQLQSVVVQDQMVTGLAIPGFYPECLNHFYPGEPVKIWGVIATIDSNDYNHPTFHFTRPFTIDHAEENESVYLSGDCYIGAHYTAECIDKEDIDTILGAKIFYFDEPLILSDTFYVGVFVCDAQDYSNILPIEIETFIPCSPNQSQWTTTPNIVYRLDSLDSLTFNLSWIGRENNPACYIICPISTVPDTDTFGCPEVEGFAFAGMNAGSPTFVWDTASEHEVHHVAYGPYDAPLESLRIAETNARFLELFDNSLRPDIYYQARVRARCHHRCPIHDTVMWTAWSAPVYFYTGDHMPDTTHQPEGIAAPGEVLPFAIVPNPSRSGARQVVEIGRQVPLQGLTLTLHDAAGHEVLRMEVKEHRFALPASLPAGVYVATLASPQGTAVRRVVVES